MNYQEAWSFLDQLQFHKIKLGLDSMNHFLGALDNPQHNLPCVHIGGTNGKGSVGSTLLTILSKAGYKVGLYTSPHLSSVRERFRIGDSYISEKDFAAEASTIKEVLGDKQITYFEFTTSLAFLWFNRQKVDLAILEVGMGGRLDATNVVTPLVSVITNVSMDHELYLGNTLADVAGEKAGIIKEDIPLVSGINDDIALAVIENKCQEQKSPLYLLGKDFTSSTEKNSTSWYYKGISQPKTEDTAHLHELPLSLSGNYQVSNAAVSLAVLELLQKHHNFSVTEEQIRTGLTHVRWPGRLEEFWMDTRDNLSTDTRPLEYSSFMRHFLLDGAHNPAGVDALKEALESSFPRQKLILIWAAMADKDLSQTLPTIAELADTIILTQPESKRSAPPEMLRQILPENLRERSACKATVEEALRYAEKQASVEDLICIAGSLFLVGKARQLLRGELVDAQV